MRKLNRKEFKDLADKISYSKNLSEVEVHLEDSLGLRVQDRFQRRHSGVPAMLSICEDVSFPIYIVQDYSYTDEVEYSYGILEQDDYTEVIYSSKQGFSFGQYTTKEIQDNFFLSLSEESLGSSLYNAFYNIRTVNDMDLCLEMLSEHVEDYFRKYM